VISGSPAFEAGRQVTDPPVQARSAVAEFDRARSDPRPEIRQGAIVALSSFAALFLWAALAPLDDGVHAHGTIAVAGNRQAVQHRDGGVVEAIHVREGEAVREGEPLIDLAAPELRASERALTSDYLTLLAQRARLEAERAGRREILLPSEFAHLSSEDRKLASEALDLQRGQMRARVEALDAERSVLGQRARQLAEQQSGYQRQRHFLAEQADLVAQELAGQRQLEAKNLAPLSRIKSLERAGTDLQRQQAALAAEHASAGVGIRETRAQDLSLTRKTLEDVVGDLRDTQEKLSEILPKLVAAREQLERSRLRAPVTGTVVGLNIFTVGGVIEPGKPVMEIVPDGRSLIIRANVDPRDADQVLDGETARVRFLSVHDRSLPLFEGKVRKISADAFTDKTTGRSYFGAEVAVPASELGRVDKVLGRGRLRPGLPVDVVLSVHKRTALQMLIAPLAKEYWRSFREQ
jgi:HlyD family type I secretion membrane fusion protein